jgi:bifunctional non-homologous end joining protein LigD
VLRPSNFVAPCEPVLRNRPPKGDAWLHEVKFDGYRIQVHKAGGKVTLFTRRGHDWTRRFPHLAAELRALPTCILDTELVAAHEQGIADFRRLHRTVSKRQEEGLTLWA